MSRKSSDAGVALIGYAIGLVVMLIAGVFMFLGNVAKYNLWKKILDNLNSFRYSEYHRLLFLFSLSGCYVVCTSHSLDCVHSLLGLCNRR